MKKPSYVGHSWDGNIGTILASDSPEIIFRAFLEGPVYWRMNHAFIPRFPAR